jgi:hypothetical protein
MWPDLILHARYLIYGLDSIDEGECLGQIRIVQTKIDG